MSEWSLAVAIPVRNEAQLLPRCLASLAVAQERVKDAGVEVAVVAVLDSCTDSSPAIAASYSWLATVKAELGSAGAARAVAASQSIQAAQSMAPDSHVWLATTDADSAVPPHWLTRQLELARSGVELMLGTVEPDPVDLGAPRLAHWWKAHSLNEGHIHVFGANLAMTAAAYSRAGGFPAVPVGEDVQLVERLKASGVPWVATDTCRVLTSGRTDGRTESGFAGYLRSSG